MIREEIVKRSPLRLLEKSLGGGLKDGEIGVLASRRGIGKTACLVHIATEKLFQEKAVIHVSYSSRVDYIINWYEDIFKEIAKERHLDSAVEVHDDIIKNRVIMNFNQDGIRTDQVLRSLGVMIKEGNFAADTLIVDGYDFPRSCSEDLRKFKAFAEKLGVRVWFSASLKGDEPLFSEEGIPLALESSMDLVDVLITLGFKDNYVKLYLVKNRNRPGKGELNLRLDPNTLLIAKDS